MNTNDEKLYLPNDFSAQLIQLSLQKLDFEETQITHTTETHSELNKGKNSLKLNITTIPKTNADYQSNSQSIYVEFNVIAERNLNTLIQTIQVVYKALFIVKPILSEEAMQAFVNINGIAIVYPFIRETVFSVTVKSKGGGLILPIMNFIEEYRKNMHK